ncbi:MAG TPA: hypothetical protein VFK02_28215 [Kofleriaceae bacterium]|nr:hypothetical protein [Kofleriaceae bacterium]
MSTSYLVRACSIASLAACWLAAAAGCGPSSDPAPDAPPVSMIPTSPAGRFAVTSTVEFGVPPPAAPVISELIAATDGPDDPTRYLVDRMVETLPDGTVKDIAIEAAPYVAAYLNSRLAEVAPRLTSGIHAIAGGLSRVAGRLETSETLVIDGSGGGMRTITGARFDVAGAGLVVRFADAGLPDITAITHVALDATGRVTFSDHTHAVPYSDLLRLGLDRAVVAAIEPTARDLSGALGALIDCDRLGVLIDDRVGLGGPEIYATACRAAMTAIASELYALIDAIGSSPVALEVTGAADGVDRDGDGSMDELRAGSWAGSLTAGAAREPLGAASFSGQRAP